MSAVKNGALGASEMLAEALKQMDGILAGTSPRGYQNGVIENSSPKLPKKMQEARTVKLIEDLRVTLESSGNPQQALDQISDETKVFFRHWLAQTDYNHTGACASGESIEEKAQRLEQDRDSLVLQVNYYAEQLDAQTDKMRDLECSLEYSHKTLQTTEDMLQNELLSKTSLESHKMDLMAELSTVKMRLANSEKARQELADRLDYAHRRLDDLQSRLNDKTIEVSDLRTKISRNGTIPSTDSLGSDCEVEKLKKAVESLMIANDEKDKHIDELKMLVKRYKKIEELVLSSKGKKVLDQLTCEDDQSDTSSTKNSGGSLEETLKENQQLEKLHIGEHLNGKSTMPYPNATSTPVNAYGMLPKGGSSTLPPPSSPPSAIMETPRKSTGVVRSNSCEEMTPKAKKTPPTSRRKGPGFGTLPKDVRLNAPPASPIKPTPRHTHSMPRKNKPFMSFGKGIFKMRPAKWTTSAPNLANHGRGWYSDDEAQTETDDEALKDEMAQQYKLMQHTGPDQQRKRHKGLKRFFGRLRRSNSQDLDDKLEGFKRSGLRATAGARLGWSKDLAYNDIDVPFARWDADQVAAWLHAVGLSMYVGDCKRWVKNGDQLLKASAHDLEKELGIRNHFHRKKLQLGLQAIGSDSQGLMDKLDHIWVTRWLDDIGLPQYKDAFLDARIDGRMLHYLTVDDLLGLKVTNALHHLSIKRGIQCLRMNQFDTSCMKRRPAPDEVSLHDCPKEVVLWTNHRVMEWLRNIDLSEYAPNMRGSGVHGCLMVMEPRFGAELFASLLSIPASKTLLRRHLSTHFVSLIGIETQHKKREFQSHPGFIPLTPNLKIKSRKMHNFGLFSHRRTKSDTEEEFVCPMNASNALTDEPDNQQQNGGVGWKRQPMTIHEAEKDEKAAKEIGAFSQELNSLTHMLAKEKFLDDVPTSNV